VETAASMRLVIRLRLLSRPPFIECANTDDGYALTGSYSNFRSIGGTRGTREACFAGESTESSPRTLHLFSVTIIGCSLSLSLNER